MATRTLVIDGDDLAHFFVAIDGDTLRLGDAATQPNGAVRGLRVARIRCEIDVDDDGTDLRIDDDSGLHPALRNLPAGETVQIGHCHVNVRSNAMPSLAPDLSPVGLLSPSSVRMPVLPPPPATLATLPKRLHVIDGADQGRMFGLPTSGTVYIGKSGKHSDIPLHDLYVSRVHCSLEITGEQVVVTHLEGDKGTLVDGEKIDGPESIRPGCILRVGNSYLRLEVGEPEANSSSDADYEVIRDPSTVHTTGPKSSGALRRPADPLEGVTLGHYTLDRLVGRGHTSVTYRANDTKQNRTVAVKVFPPEFPANQAELERFAKEIKAACPVVHPHLVALYGAGKTGAHCWVAREYVDGESADHLVARVAEGEKLNWSRALKVAVHLARAVDGLHHHKQVHGCVTPRNVIIRHDDHGAKLADLGLGRALAGSQLARAVREQKEAAELAYLAPEQMDNGAFVDDLADLYAVGAVTYAVLTGRPPFPGDDVEAVRKQVLTVRPVKPSTYHKKVPSDFEAAILKSLAKHQEDRYQTAGELLRALLPIAEMHDVKL